MRIIALHLSDIDFNVKDYEETLYQSILRRGLAFPIKVSLKDGKYTCVDGHKRLSVLSAIALGQPNHRYVVHIPVIVVNSELNRSNDCWNGRNTH